MAEVMKGGCGEEADEIGRGEGEKTRLCQNMQRQVEQHISMSICVYRCLQAHRQLVVELQRSRF